MQAIGPADPSKPVAIHMTIRAVAFQKRRRVVSFEPVNGLLAARTHHECDCRVEGQERQNRKRSQRERPLNRQKSGHNRQQRQ